MRALLLHDLRWAGTLAVAGVLVFLGILSAEDVYKLWAQPENMFGALGAGFLGPAVAVLALCAALFDELTRTREYLRHRPLGPRRLFWTRQALALAVVLLWVAGVPALHLLAATLWSPDAALIDHGRLGLYVAQGLPALFLYALMLFAASLTRHRVTGIVLALALGLALALIIAGWLFAGPPGATTWTVLLALALTPPLLVAAERCQRDGRDADRPWSTERLTRAGGALVLVAAIVGASALTIVHALGRRWLNDAYPRVVADGEGGGLVLAREPSRSHPHYRQVDRQHALDGKRLPADSRRLFQPRKDGPWNFATFPFEDEGFPGGGNRFRGLMHRRVLLDYRAGVSGFLASDGYLHVYRFAQDDGEGADRPLAVRAGRGGPDRPFSANARLLGWPLGSTVVVHDPEDGGIWGYRWGSSRDAFSLLPLPGGDRVVGLADRTPTSGSWVEPAGSGVVVEGTRGFYLLGEDGFVPAPPRFRPRPRARAVAVVQHDATRFAVTVAPDGAQPGFQHLYRPHTVRERAAAFVTRAPTLLRPLPLTLASLAVEPRAAFGYFGYLLLDQPVTLGDGAALTGNVLLSLLLAGLAHWRLGRLGAARGRRLWWAGAVLVGGAPGFLCLHLIETARAWRGMPAAAPAPAPTPPAPLVLVSEP
jgi:hypothetical protein